MTLFSIFLVIATAITGSIIGVPYLWWNVIFAEGGLLSVEAGVAVIGTVSFWGSAFLAIDRHDVHWLWRGAGVVAAAMVISSLVQWIRHRPGK